MECVEEELSPWQKQANKKAEEEYQAALKKIEEAKARQREEARVLQQQQQLQQHQQQAVQTSTATIRATPPAQNQPARPQSKTLSMCTSRFCCIFGSFQRAHNIWF